jgi:excisionase family DNA binding protein
MSNDTKSLSALWRYPDAARYLGISPATLRRKVMEAAVPFYRPFGKHGRVLFDPDDLRNFVQASRVAPITE